MQRAANWIRGWAEVRVTGDTPEEFFTLVTGVCVGALVIWMHRGNIQRLLRGEERRFTLHHKEE